MFKRHAFDPPWIHREKFSTIKDKCILSRYSQQMGNPAVPSISGLDNVVRLNSTYLEFADRQHFWRGALTLCGGFFFGLMFIAIFLWQLVDILLQGGMEPLGWGILIVVWAFIALPASWASAKLMLGEVFYSTYYPIRFNRKNKMVYVYREGNPVLAVPWQEIVFVLASNGGKPETWSIYGCVTGEDGETVTAIIPLPVSLNWGAEYLAIFWEFIRCYMEEEACLADLADTIPYCLPLDKQKEGWLFGLAYICKQNGRLGLVNFPLFPLLLLVSISRWLVMLTCRIPVWPPEVEAACAVAADDPINRGAETNPPQVWRSMLAVQGRARYARALARERGAMDRIIAYLKEKYGEKA